jgi:hypothetical protein
VTTDRELMQMALDALEKLVNETPTTHVRAGKAQIGGKEVVALWFDDCSDPLQQAIYINATKPEKIKEFLKQVRDRLAQPELEFSIQAGKHRQPLKQVDPSSVYLTKPNNPTPSIEAALDKMVAENERLGLYDDLDEAIKKGTKAWEGVDSTQWVEELRGGPEPEPYDPMENNADYERGFIDGRADQMKSSVDRAVNRMAKCEWVGFTAAERDEIVPMLVQSLVNHDDKTMTILLRAILIDVEERLKEKNT